MGSWQARASTASITGACVFAVVTGAGAVFVGDWWGSHHAPVVTEFVTTPASPPHGSHPAVARSVHPVTARHRAISGAPAPGEVQADAQTARVAGTGQSARAHPPAKPAAAGHRPAGHGPDGQKPPGPASTSPAAVPSVSASGSAPASTPGSGRDTGASPSGSGPAGQQAPSSAQAPEEPPGTSS
jgi:hypothetical protein